MRVFLSVPILIATRMACEGYDGLQPLAFILGAEVPQPEGVDSDRNEQLETESQDEHLTVVQP